MPAYQGTTSVEQNTNSTAVINDPGFAGSFLLFIAQDVQNAATTWSPPDGTWLGPICALNGGALDSTYLTVFYKKSAVGSGTYTFIASNALWQGTATISAFSGVSSGTSVDASGAQATDPFAASPITLVAPSIATIVDNDLLVAVYMGIDDTVGTESFTDPAGYTRRSFIAGSAFNTAFVLLDKSGGTHGTVPAANATFDTTAGPGNVMGGGGGLIALAPSTPSNQLAWIRA